MKNHQLFIDGYSSKEATITTLLVMVDSSFLSLTLPHFIVSQRMQYVGIVDDFESHKFEPISLN